MVPGAGGEPGPDPGRSASRGGALLGDALARNGALRGGRSEGRRLGRGCLRPDRDLRLPGRADDGARARARSHGGRGRFQQAHGGAPRDLPRRRGPRYRARGGALAHRRVRNRVRGLREARRPDAARRPRAARGRPLPRQASRVAVLPRGRRPGDRPGLDREGRRARRGRERVPLRRRPGAPARGRGLRRGRPRPRRRPVEGALSDDGQPHGDAPPAQGAPGGPRRPRAPGRVGGAPRQAPLRLHAHRRR